MKEKGNLQKGNLVLVNNIPVKVESIEPLSIGYYKDKKEDRLYFADFDTIEPIRLTPMLLGNLGFKVFKGAERFKNYRLVSGQYTIHLENMDLDTNYDIHVIKQGESFPRHYDYQLAYYHELQNAIREITDWEVQL